MTEETFEPNPLITQAVMEQYEKVRQSGMSNMFDTNGVALAALKLKCYNLVELLTDRGTKGAYVQILTNFSKYMKLYNIRQE